MHPILSLLQKFFLCGPALDLGRAGLWRVYLGSVQLRPRAAVQQARPPPSLPPVGCECSILHPQLQK